MADELTVSIGGGTRVAVDELFGEAATLGAVHRACDEWAERASYFRQRLIHEGLADAPSPGGDGAAFSLAHARMLLGDAADDAGRLQGALVTSAERYGYAERAVAGMWDLGVRYAAYLAGLTFPLWAIPAAAVAARLGVALQAAAGHGLWKPERAATAMLTDPTFIRLVRSAGGALDEAVLGLLRLPPGLVTTLGRGLGAPENSSLVLGAMGALGLFGSRVLVDGPVSVRQSGTGATGVKAPRGIGELAARIPPNPAGAPQVRVERYGAASSPHWVVYITGTIAGTAVAGSEPWDLTSDVHAVADDSKLDLLRLAGEPSGGADRAVRQALAEAGARPGDPILPIGHSAGGMIAAQLATDPELNVVAAINLGGAVASAQTADVPVLSLEHEEDPVPALGGTGHPSPGLVTVRREALDGDESGLLPAHELARYRETALLVDDARTPEVVAFGDLVREFTAGGEGERTEWRADRVSPERAE